MMGCVRSLVDKMDKFGQRTKMQQEYQEGISFSLDMVARTSLTLLYSTLRLQGQTER